MSNIILIGANHKTAPVELREKLSFSDEETLSALETFKNDSAIKESMVFSTCNRTEILYIPESDDEVDPADPVDQMIEFISAHKNIEISQFKDALYVHKDEMAIQHLFKVAASLDSMVVGEPQILGQIKQAYRVAVKESSSGVLLNRLMHKSFFPYPLPRAL